MHPFLSAATRQQVIDAGLEIEADFWTYQGSTWACVNTQFKNMVLALEQHGQHITPYTAANPPQFILDFEQLAIQPNSKLTVDQAARKVGLNQSAYICCWWGKVAGAQRYYGGLPPSIALNNYICRQIQKTTTTSGIRIPWWGAGIDYNKIAQIQLENLNQ